MHSHITAFTLSDAMTPGTLAKLLLRFIGRESDCGKGLLKVLKALHAEQQKDTLGSNPPASVVVPKSVTKTWKALLFSEKFSDEKFKCQDGTVFHAHKCRFGGGEPVLLRRL